MAKLTWTQSAINDLDSIGEYISINSEYAAQKFIENLIKKTNTLVTFPERGHPIPENLPWEILTNSL